MRIRSSSFVLVLSFPAVLATAGVPPVRPLPVDTRGPAAAGAGAAPSAPQPRPAIEAGAPEAPSPEQPWLAAPEASQISRDDRLVPPELEALIARAIAVHPRIASARARAEASRTRARTAGALEDPTATISYQNEGFRSVTLGDSEDAQVALAFVQPLPGRGKRALRTDVAERDADVDVPSIRRELLDLTREIVTSWWSLAYELEARATLTEQKALANEVEGFARSRYAAGGGTQLDVLRAQMARTRLGEALAISEATLAGRRAALRGLLVPDASGDWPDPGPLPALPAPPDADEAVARALAESPDVQRLERAAAAAQSRVALARGDYRPDYAIGGAYMYRGSLVQGRLDPMIAVSFGIRLPVHRAARLGPALDAATGEVDSRRGDEAALRLLLEARTRERIAVIGGARDAIRLLEGGLIPQERLAFDSAVASYRSGRADLFPVLGLLDALLVDKFDLALRRLAIALEAAALDAFAVDPPIGGGAGMDSGPAFRAQAVSGVMGPTSAGGPVASPRSTSPTTDAMGVMR